MDEAELQQKTDEFIAQNKAAIVADIGRLVAVRSVEEAPAGPGAPFGKGPRKALDVALAMAQEMGFAPHDEDGYLGWFELPGKEAGHLATITHLDVVPEGEGWDGEAYTLREKDGWLLGRGVADDKGPSVLCLYLAKFFKQNNVPLRYGLRILLGCNEETGMADVAYYLARQPQPLFCFTPDAEFPVSYGEKGHLNGVFTSPVLNGAIAEFSGGTADNVIPDCATCLVRADAAALQSTQRVTVSAEKGMARLHAQGIGGHAAMPAGSVNAIALLVEYLLQNNLCTGPEKAFLQLLQKLHAHTDGSGVGIASRDDVFDALTVCGNVITFAGGRLAQRIDSRFPTATTAEKINAQLEAVAGAAGATFAVTSAAEPFYIPQNAPVIKALLGAYNHVTGKDAQPFTMGGGTYARHFKNATSFGPEEPGQSLPPFAGPMHGANEGAQVEGLLQALKIYILAVWRLQKLDF